MRYSKTATGQLAFKQRASDISARQRSVFLLFDGVRTVDEVLSMTAGLGANLADVEDLVAKGHLARADAPPSVDIPLSATPAPDPVAGSRAKPDSTAPASAADAQTLYRQAYPVATRLTASLGLRGFRLNLAVEAAGGYQDLVDLLPQITQAVGPTAAQELKKALRLT